MCSTNSKFNYYSIFGVIWLIGYANGECNPTFESGTSIFCDQIKEPTPCNRMQSERIDAFVTINCLLRRFGQFK